ARQGWSQCERVPKSGSWPRWMGSWSVPASAVAGTARTSIASADAAAHRTPTPAFRGTALIHTSIVSAPGRLSRGAGPALVTRVPGSAGAKREDSRRVGRVDLDDRAAAGPRH